MNNDYVDFKFGDHWASEFNLLAVSNGDRHNPPVYGSVNPNTATIMGKKGVYKWKTQVNEKIFNINIAFDSVTIAQLNQIKQWLEPHKIQKLIFADEPYKYYWAALNSEIDFNFLPFIEGEKKVGERTIIEGVYKGEMTIPFICIDNDGYSEEGTFEGLENKPELATIKGSNFVITDADNDYIEDLKIEGKSEQEVKYNNDLSDTDFAKVNSRSVEKEWKTNNLAQIQAENGEVTIKAPYEYSGIAQEQRESIIDHKYYASAEVKTDNINTALEIAGKNITNSIQGKDINITDGLVGTVDDLVVGGDASQDKKYNNEINSSFLEDLDNWESVQNATISRNKQTATIAANSKFDGIAQETEESNIGDKYYLSAKVKSNSSDAVLEVETESGIAEGEQITINDAASRKLEDFKLYGNSNQEKYDEQLLGTGESITVENNTYKRYTKVNVSGNTVQEIKEKIEGNTVNGENIDLNDVDNSKEHEIKIMGNSKQETSTTEENLFDDTKIKGTIIPSSSGTLSTTFPIINKLKNNTNYYITLFINNVIYESNVIAVLLNKSDGTKIVESAFAGISINSDNMEEASYIKLYVSPNAVNKYGGQTITGLMITENPVSSYKEFIPNSPSPNYPSEIESCGDNVNILIPDVNSTAISNYNDNIYTFKENLPIAWYKYIAKVNLKANKIYTISSDNYIGYGRLSLSTSITNGEIIPDISLSSYDAIRVLTPTRKNITFTSNANQIVYLWYCTDTGVSKKDKSFTVSIKLEEGLPTPYSPYGQGCINEVICSGNLFNKNKAVNGAFILADTGEPSYTKNWNISEYIPVIAGKKYIVYGVASTTAAFYDKNKKFIKTQSITKNNIIVATEEIKYVKIDVRNDYLNTAVIIEGTEEKGYIEYQSQTYSIPTQKPMLKEDYFDFKNNKEVHIWQEVEFTGDEKWALNATYTNTIRFSLGASYLGISNIGYCNRNFVRTTEAHGDYEYVFFTNNLIYFNILKENLPTDKQNLEGFIELLRQWNSEGKPLKLYYRASQIEELDLTDEQIEVGKQISNSTLHSGTTHIYSTDEIAPVLEVKYNSQKESPSPESPSPIKNCENSINVKLTNGSQSKVISFPLVSGQKLHEGDYLAKDGIHQKRKTYILNGTEDWKLYNSSSLYRRFGLSISENIAKIITILPDGNKFGNGFCSHFKVEMTYAGSDLVSFIQIGSDNWWIGFTDFNSKWPDVAALKAYLAEQYANGTPVTLEYELAEEIIVPYTESQQAAYNQLMYLTMYQGYNLLTSDDEIKPQLEWIIPESPNPDYNQEVRSCGDNINLFDKDNINLLNNMFVNTTNKSIISYLERKCFYLKIEDNTMYTINGNYHTYGTTEEIPSINSNLINVGWTTPATFTSSSNVKYLVIYYLNENDTLTEQEILNSIKVEKSPTPTPYSKYGQGCISEVVCNKNLLKFDNIDSSWVAGQDNAVNYNTNNGIITTTNTGTYGRKIYTIKIPSNLVGKQVTFSFDAISTDASQFNKILLGNTKSVDSLNYGNITVSVVNKRYSKTFIPTSDKIYMTVYLTTSSSNSTTITIKRIMICKNEDTEYEEHKSQTYTIPTQQQFRAIGDIRDTFIKKDGKRYERHYIYRQIFDGTETNCSQSTVHNKIVYNFRIPKSSSNAEYGKIADAISSHFIAQNQNSTGKNLNRFSLTNDMVIFCTDGISTIDSFKTLLAEQYNTGTPVYVDYVLKEPIDIECTEEQNVILDSIKTYRETTHIYSTDDIIPSMQLEYIKKPQQQTKLSTTNTQETLSMIYQTNIDNTRVLVSNIGSSASLIELANPVLVNLTKQFGSGNEPTKEWCDQNLTFFNCAEGGAPSVETSSRVKTVGSNINLFDPNNHIEFDGKYRVYSTGNIVSANSFFGLKIPVLGNVEYSVSSNLARNQYFQLCYYDKDFNFMWGEIFMSGNTFRTPNKCRYITLALNRNYSWFKLEYGNTITQPSEYNLANIDTKITGYDNQFKSFPLLTGQELLQLSNGTQDTLEANGIYKRVGKYIVTGQEQFTDNGTYAVIAPTNCKENSKVYSNYFENKQNILWGVNSGIAFGYNNEIKNLAELRTFLQERYNSTNPVIIYYELKTQQIIPYSNAQKEWYDSFAIYRKNTQITTVAETKPYYSFTYDINDTYAVNSTKVNEYEKLGLIFNNLEDRPRFIVNSTADVNSTIKMRKPIIVDLTNEFGVGNEPDLEWCQNNINFDNSCEYGTPSPKVPSELISIGTNPVKIENKSRNLIMEQNLLNWRKRNCSITKLDEKFNDRSVFRINYENHFIGDISTKIQISNKDLVFSAWVRVINADNPTQNRLSVSKATSSSSSSVTITSTTFQNKIGEWQKVFVPIPQNIIADAAELTLRVNHSRPTDDSTVIDVCMPQLEEGFTPHDYLPYAPSITNNLIFTEPLRQLPNGVRDEFSKNGIIRRVGKHIIESTDGVWEATFSINKQYIIINGELGIYIRGDNFNKAPSFLCNRFKDCVSLFDISKGATSTREKEGIGVMDDEYRLCIRADLIGATQTDTEDDIIRKYKVWLADNPIEIYYEKEVADLEPLTELQLNTLNNLITRKFYNNWVISGSENPEIELTYKLSSSINDIHPWVTGSNLLDKTWLYNDNNIHTKSYIEVETGDATKSGVSADRPVYLLNSGTSDADLNLKFDYISIVSPLTIKITKGKITDNGFSEIAPVSEITIKPFLNYQPFIDLYDNISSNWYIEIDSTLGEIYLRHKTDESKVLNLNRFNDNHTFLTLASCNFVDYNKIFPTIISEIKDTAIENTIFNKLSVASAPEAYRLKNASIEWKHTYL